MAKKTSPATPGHAATPASAKAAHRHRSPNYPLFDLEKAVERTQQLYDVYKTHKAPITILHDRWGYKAMSAALKQAVAAVKSYGLVTVEGEGPARQIGVSERGRRIVLNAPDREQLLKEAALGPALFRGLWDRYSNEGIPADDILRHHLIFDRNFNEDTVADAIARFKTTLTYAKLSPGDKIAGVEGGEESEDDDGNDRDEDDVPPASSKKKEKRRMIPEGSQEFAFELEEGPAVLTLPQGIGSDSTVDLEDWLKLVVRKIKRSTKTTTGSEPEIDQDDEGE